MTVLTKEEADEVLAEIAEHLPEDMPPVEKIRAAAAVMRMKAATPAKGGDRAGVLRSLGWGHGVCYKLDKQLVIAAWCAIGKGEEYFATMPKRGRPKTKTGMAGSPVTPEKEQAA